MVDRNVIGQNQMYEKTMSQISKQFSAKIDDFLILCVYEQDYKWQEERGINLDQLKGSLADLPIFIDVHGTNSFIIWERVYQESAQVFNSLRLISRNRLIWYISENIVTFLSMKYKKFSPAITSVLDDKRKKKQSVQYIEEIVKRDTFLVDDDVWNNFCEWFRIHLTEWVLEEMVQSLGANRLAELDKKELNELFYQYISLNLSENKQFIEKFKTIVNGYTIDWVKKIIAVFNLENCSIQQIESLLGLRESPFLSGLPTASSINQPTFPLAVHDSIFVMNNAPYQAVREAFYKNSFAQTKDDLWPTALLVKGSVKGVLQIKPFKKDHYTFTKHHSIVKETWEEAKGLSDLEADIFDVLCTIFLFKAKHADDVVEIQLDDLLAIRGLKAKLGGEGRRGGYEEKQRRQIVKSLSIIQKLWISLDKTIVYEKGRPAETMLEGRAFLFVDQNQKEIPITEEVGKRKLRYKVDQIFARYLFGSGRQVALLPLKVLHYDPYRKSWEKRLTRYLSWRWRIQARKGDFLQPNKVSTLLEAVGVKINERTPSRTRERLENAFDTLQQDGLIGAWHYDKWDESIADQKGWGRIWLSAMIMIHPPEFIKEQYRSIRKNPPSQATRQPPKEVSGELDEMIGARIRETREKFNLSLTQVAEEIEISSSYLSHIEREMKIPSRKIQYKLMKWLERFQ